MPLPTDAMTGSILFASLIGPTDGYVVRVSLHAEFVPAGSFTPDDLQVVLGAPTAPNFDHWVVQGGPDLGWGTGSGLHVGNASTVILNGELQSGPLGVSIWNLTIEPVQGSGHNGVTGAFTSNAYFEVEYLPVGEGPAVGYCFGTGCPCGNDDPAAGCANSTGAGALLSATGLASAALDDLALRLADVPAGNVGLCFLGQAQTSLPFGDGLRCVGPGPLGLIRLPAGVANASGTIDTPAVISTAGLAAGDTWNVQGWYRDPTGPCGTGYSTSNGLTFVVVP
ncbi:MAG TPA: hypothetical protein VMT18_05320 [Planctomycetota bacterium]|nr:hypothetical protein [Planctomycetota bacterium]